MFDVKNVLFIVALIALCFLAIPVKVSKPNLEQKLELFSSFQQRYKKSYSKSEHDIRFKNFEKSLDIIEELNKNRPSPESARYGITEFSDLSEEEFKTRHLRHSVNKHVLMSHHKHHDHHHNHVKKRSITTGITIPTGIPVKKDWREAGIIGKVRNQQTCGACWAFSTVETAESMHALKNGTLSLLSVQEVIDCAGNGNMGCSGGDFCALLDWMDVNKVVLEPESEYPLLLKDAACKRKATSPNGVKIKSYTCDTESSILTDIATHGPVIAAVNALTWQYYLGGIIQYNCDGSLANINHAVQIVGYDSTAGIPHYIIRNSWGTSFGDNGYVYLAIGSNVCGIRTELSTLDVV
ncbi:hypothetical protein M8J75_000111 [Diaphorina citri]|nr:hypothetical protein M8J75_000111 [Diaphorina citri]